MPTPERPRLSSTSLVAVSVVAVVALLVMPSWVARRSVSGPGRPRPPAPTRVAEQVGTRTWSATQCPGGNVGCRVPVVINLGGAQFVHRHGHQQAVEQRDPDTRTLARTVSPAAGHRWLLVGADGASSASQLSIRLGDSPPASLAPGTLTFLSVPGTHRPVRVTVTDYGRVGGGEVLHLEEYDALGQ